MLISIEANDKTYRIETGKPLSLAIPLVFNGAQPNAYGVEPASSKACEAGSLVGDTRRGGSCNFEEYRFIPHCNGTHTESVGHITHERLSVHDCLREAFLPAFLISVEPESAGASADGYAVELAETDRLITRRLLAAALAEMESRVPDFKPGAAPFALVVRTLPNDERKLTRVYLEDVPPFFSTEAMELISELGVRHLLADLPSIDRIYDEGKLANHRLFWNVEPGSFELKPESRARQTITELIYAPPEIADGFYLLNLQIAPFAADASPSRPLLFAVADQ